MSRANLFLAAFCATLPCLGFSANYQAGDGADAGSYPGATAVGENASATFNSATAVGSGAVALDHRATAVGKEAEAGADQATAVGYKASAQGNSSTAVGYGASTTADSAVAVGALSTAAQSATALGYGSKANGGGSTAVGGGETSGNYAIAVGKDTKASADGASAIGQYANAGGSRAIAHGVESSANADYSTAVGERSSVTAINGTAMGSQAKVSVAGGVALGSQSNATRGSGVRGYVPEGASISEEQKQSSTWTSSMAEASFGYTDAQGQAHTRQLTHVAAGTQDTDAVNVAQLKAVSQQFTAEAYERMSAMGRHFERQIDDLEEETRAGIAMALATAGLPQAYRPGKSMIAGSAGVFHGESGYAIGISHITEGGNWVFKATGSGNSQGDFGGSIGAGYQW